MTNREALQIISENLAVAIHDADGINPEYEYEQVNALDMAYDALEKQIPKKPDYEGDGYDDGGNIIFDTWICPNCEKHFEMDYEEFDFCPNCGQAIDWSDEVD